MSANFTIQRATTGDVQEVAVMVGELLVEIMNAIGVQVFNFDLAETTLRSKTSLTVKSILCLSLVGRVVSRQGLLLFMKVMRFTPKVLSVPFLSFTFARSSAQIEALVSFLKPNLSGRRAAGRDWKLQHRHCRSSTEPWHFMGERVLPLAAAAS